MAASLFDPCVLPEGWFSIGSSGSGTSWFDAELSDSTAITGVAAISLTAITCVGSVQVLVQAAEANTLGAASVSGAGVIDVQGAAAITLGAAAVAAVGQVDVRLNGILTSGQASLAASAVAPIQASASLTLGGASSASEGALLVAVTGAVSAGAVGVTGAAVVAVQGAAALTAGAMTLSAVAVTSFTIPCFAEANITLGAVNTSAIVAIPISSSGSVTLGALTASGVIANHHPAFGKSTGRTLLTVKQGDLEPPVMTSILGVDGAPIDLTYAGTVFFRLAHTLERQEVFTRQALVEDAGSGLVAYPWQDGDTTAPGVYYGEFVVFWPGGRVETYPQAGYLIVVVEPRL